MLQRRQIVQRVTVDEKQIGTACHEGNNYVMQGILAGARAEEKAATEGAKSPK